MVGSARCAWLGSARATASRLPPAACSPTLPARKRSLTTNSPLCIEEFDLTDRNFRPCPCGYKVRRAFSFASRRRLPSPRPRNPVTNLTVVTGLPVLLQQHQK